MGSTSSSFASSFASSSSSSNNNSSEGRCNCPEMPFDTLAIYRMTRASSTSVVHALVYVRFKCRECKKAFGCKFDFNQDDKYMTWQKDSSLFFMDKKIDESIDDREAKFSYRWVERAFREMPGSGHYHLTGYNCFHWAKEFYNKFVYKVRKDFRRKLKEVVALKVGECRRYSLKSALNGAIVEVHDVLVRQSVYLMVFQPRITRLIAGKGHHPLVFEQFNNGDFEDCWMRRADDDEDYFVELEGNNKLVSRFEGSYLNSQRFSAAIVGVDEGGPLMRLSLLDTKEEAELGTHKDVDRVVTVEEDEGGNAWIKVVNRPKAQSASEREALKHRRQDLFYLVPVP